jgi:predicted NACHT family NTPase
MRFKALALKKSILTQPSVRELATNPLLLTTLALLHYSGGSLPKQRVELYRIAVQCLVEVWRNSGLMVEEVIGVLSPLAFHIHSHYPTGLIEQEKLKAIVAKSLAKARNIDPNNPPSTFESDVNTFLTGKTTLICLFSSEKRY